jgi:hypothetical protein
MLIKKTLILFFLIVIIMSLIGVAIPKLTVHDKVAVDKEFRKDTMQAVNVHYDNPFERLALWLGKSRIVSATQLSAEVESFTLFNIPLGFFHGVPDMKLGIFFNQDGDWSAKYISDVIGLTASEEENSLWKTFIDENQKIKFQYPSSLIAKYISTVEWPPVLTIDENNHEFVCDETPATSSLLARTMQRKVDNRVYCLYASSEGAAGSVYTDYTYSTLWNGKTVKMKFTLQYPRCDNYDEPKQTECKGEREVFDLDGVIDRIFLSMKEL